jgi:hypothetical protein
MGQTDAFTVAIRSVLAVCAKKAHQKVMFLASNMPNPALQGTRRKRRAPELER